jgi:hypothetical protein
VRHGSLRFVWIFIASVMFFYGYPTTLSAQQTDQWSPRERIPGSQDNAETPYLVVDQNRTVHVFHSQNSGGREFEVDIVYSRWSLDQGWTEPIDILLSPLNNQARVRGAFLDQAGVIHLIFFAGDTFAANIYYSSAPAVYAGQAFAWSKPIMIGDAAVTPVEAALAGDEEGNLIVVYSGNRDGKGIYVVASQDTGSTWSDPGLVSWSYRDDQHPFGLQLHQDPYQNLHVVWTVNNAQGNGETIEYVRLERSSSQWLPPVTLAVYKEEHGYEVDHPAIVFHEGQLIFIYNDYHPPKRMMRLSSDGGRTWSEPFEAFAPTRGEYGAATFAVDSNNTLHVIFGDRGRSLTLWHSIWRGSSWQEPEPIVPLGESNRYDREHPRVFHPQRPKAVISQGNILLVTWRTDWGFGRNGTWYSYRQLDAPALPIVELPVPTSAVTPTPAVIPPTSTPTPTPSPTPTPVVLNWGDDIPAAANNPTGVLAMSIIPVAVLLLIVGARQWYSYTHRE